MLVSIVAAMDRRRLIGRDGALPWRLPADLRRFRALTLGKPVVMGRKTFESIGRVLDGRLNVVLTGDRSFHRNGAMVCHSLDAGLAACQGRDEVMIIGGASIYAQALAHSDRMYLTLIDEVFEGDAYFPRYEPCAWEETEREDHPAGEVAQFGFSYLTLRRLV